MRKTSEHLEGIFSWQKKDRYFSNIRMNLSWQQLKHINEGSVSYKVVVENLDIRSCTQLKVWVRKWRDGEEFDVRKGVSNPLKGRPRTGFGTVEEERDYLKAQVDYLKKRYPNLIKERTSASGIPMK
jgi:transposase